MLINVVAWQIAPLPAATLPPLLQSALWSLQPLVLLCAGALVGSALAPRLGLRSLVAERAAGRAVAESDLRGIAALMLASVALGFVVNLADAATLPLWLPPGARWTAYEDAWSPVTLVFGLLYGGLTEEVTYRWGLMSLIAWLAWRIGGDASRHHAVHRAWWQSSCLPCSSPPRTCPSWRPSCRCRRGR